MASPTYLPEHIISDYSPKPVKVPEGWTPVLLRDERTGGVVHDWLSSYTFRDGAKRARVDAAADERGVYWSVVYDEPYVPLHDGREKTVLAACRAAEKALARKRR